MFSFWFLCLWPSSTMTIWGKAKIKVGVIYWNGVSHYVSWIFHFSNSFSWNKWPLQCPRTAAFTAWNLFLVGLNIMIQDLKSWCVFFLFQRNDFQKECMQWIWPTTELPDATTSTLFFIGLLSSYFTEQQQKVSFNQCLWKAALQIRCINTH